MTFSLGEYQDIFLEEADEQLQELNQNLLELERNPEDSEIINNIFRAAHSLKSSAAFVGLNDLSDLAHKMENLLQGIRDHTMKITPVIVDVIFKCFDKIRIVIDTVAGGEAPKEDLSGIIAEIKAVSEGAPPPDSAAGSGEGEETEEVEELVPKTVLTSDDFKSIKSGLDAGSNCYEVTVTIDRAAQMKWVKAQLIISNIDRNGSLIKTIPSIEDMISSELQNVFKFICLLDQDYSPIVHACNVDQVEKAVIKQVTIENVNGKAGIRFNQLETVDFTEAVSSKPVVSEGNVPEPVRVRDDDVSEPETIEDGSDEAEEADSVKVEEAVESVETERKRAPVLKTVKVSIDKLDQLLNNVGELVIANSGFYRLFEDIRKLSEGKALVNEFKNRMEQMSRIAKDLQTGIMKTRMVPIGQVFSRFNRLVRDLARDYDKKIELVIKGEETELDKKVIDAIGEPLMHLIRNAIDHGIERAEQRKKAGKPDVASIILNAHQGGNQIYVEVSDDGKGLDAEVIRKKVIEKDLATVEILANMDDTDIYNFIFAPGFSTAEKVTDISGRGVGMNVVREIVNELNGNVMIETEKGMGTRFVMAFPLTLAIIPAIMTRMGGDMYAVPLSDVNETIKISQSDITTIEGHEVINLRGEILSLLRLSRFVRVKSRLKKGEKIPVVVVQYGNRKIGLMVDDLEGKMEIVIKSLEQNYKTVEGLAGASILGDGSICLILDVATMINKTISEQEKLGRIDIESLQEGEVEVEEVSELPDLSAVSRSEGLAEEEDEDSEFLASRQFNKEVEVPIQKSILFNEPSSREIAGEQPAKIDVRAGEEHKADAKADDQESHEIVSEAGETAEDDNRDFQGETADETYQEEGEGSVEAETQTEEKGVEEEQSPIKKELTEEEIEQKVHNALEDFKKELKENVNSAIRIEKPDDIIAREMDLPADAVREFQLIANVGAANAAESLSKILGIRIDLSIPEVDLCATESIPEKIGDVSIPYYGIMMPIQGDASGTMILILGEEVAFELLALLLGSYDNKNTELTEDGQSALKEVTNIIGASVLNVFSEKTRLAIKPDVPLIVHDFMQSVMDSILATHNMMSDYAIVMDTAFYFENDKIIGNLLLLPDTDSMKVIVERLRTANV